MNREQRRKSGLSKETSDKLENFKKPCTILECVQLSQGVADDKVHEYHEHINPIIVSLSIQVELLKELLFKSGEINEEEYLKLFNEKVLDYNKKKEEAIKVMEQQSSSNSNYPNTVVEPSDLNIEVESK